MNEWRVERMNADEFLIAMLALGKPLEISFVGVFDNEGRASRRDVDLPMHRDGVRSDALAAIQNGLYVEQPNVRYVGLYCLKAGISPCYTLLGREDCGIEAEVQLAKGEALIFDNTKLLHGRRGLVGERVLLRVWIAGKE